MYTRAMRIFDINSKELKAVASLDTLCQTGIWISRRLVKRLGRLGEILPANAPPNLRDVNGCPVECCGKIRLEWVWSPNGTRVYQEDFYVFPKSSHIDVIFGIEYIVAKNLLSVNENSFAPMVIHTKESISEFHCL